MKLLPILPVLLAVSSYHPAHPPSSESSWAEGYSLDQTMKKKVAANDPKLMAAYVGSYTATHIIKGRRIEDETLPPGQQLLFKLKADSTWLVHDMLTQFAGHWKLTNGKIILIPETGPSGKIKDKTPWILTPTPDRMRLILIQPKNGKDSMEFHFDPNAEKNINKAMEERMKTFHE